jgi:hypothetical protein
MEPFMSDSIGQHSSNGHSKEQRIQSLKAQHSELESALEEEEARPLPDSLAIASLKRKKLAIKDEIEQLISH